MEQIRYTIVIEDGKLSGISQHNGKLDAVPLTIEELTAIVPELNVATMAKIADMATAAKEAETKASEELKAAADAAASEISALKSDLSTTASALASMDAYKAEMVSKVKKALQSNNPENFQAVAVEFLTPEDQKERQAKIAEIESLESKIAAMKSELGI